MNAPRSASLGQKAAVDRSRWLAKAGGQRTANRAKWWGAWRGPAGRQTTEIQAPAPARRTDKSFPSYAAEQEPDSQK